MKLVTRIGYVPPMAIYSATLATVGSGLYSLLKPDSSTGEWVGFQVITGIGRGAGFQMVMLSREASLHIRCPILTKS